MGGEPSETVPDPSEIVLEFLMATLFQGWARDGSLQATWRTGTREGRSAVTQHAAASELIGCRRIASQVLVGRGWLGAVPVSQGPAHCTDCLGSELSG